jgi:hypothetical protein
MDIDTVQDAELDELRMRLSRMEGRNKRKSVKGSFSVKKKLRVAPITKRMRSTGVTPRTAQKADTRTSRSRQMQPRQLTFGSVSRSRSISRPKSMNIDTPLIKSVQYKQTREVRHKNARSKLNKMPRGGKPYARGRQSMRKPKGAYRGAVMPRWAKGETKHILAHDGMASGTSNAPVTTTCAQLTKANLLSAIAHTGETALQLGKIESWCLNPCPQGNEQTSRNGRSVDGTYLRVQGHIRNRDAQNKAYVRMMVLAVKGGQKDGKAAFNEGTLFKKIDGTVVGYDETEGTGDGSKRVRSLQLDVNKQMFTKLYDQKMQLASTNESFGSSDRLFDAKIPLKQKTKFFDEHAASFENNQLVFVVYTVDPTCADAKVALTNTTGIALEFESKYSYKDF